MPPATTSPISSARLDLVSLPPSLLRLTEAGDVEALEHRLGVTVPAAWPATVPARRRLAQLAVDPGEQPWLARAIVLREAARLVGCIGFHERPDSRGRVEVGYHLTPDDRRRGYAREALTALTRWAYGTGQARVCAASVSPDNARSLGLVRSFGFVHVGEQIDEEDGLELIFERPLPLPEPVTAPAGGTPAA